MIAAREGHDVVVVNPTTPVGPGDRRPTPTGKMIADVIDGRIRAHLRTEINVVAVEDVGRGHVLAHEHGRAGQRYLLGGEDVPLAEVFATVAACAGQPAPRRSVPYSVAQASAWVADHALRVVGASRSWLNLDGFAWPAADALRQQQSGGGARLRLPSGRRGARGGRRLVPRPAE